MCHRWRRPLRGYDEPLEVNPVVTTMILQAAVGMFPKVLYNNLDCSCLAFLCEKTVRTNAINLREATSAPRLIHHGVPQGSVLGPMLFNMYILPIADIFERHQIRYHIYADDTNYTLSVRH